MSFKKATKLIRKVQNNDTNRSRNSLYIAQRWCLYTTRPFCPLGAQQLFGNHIKLVSWGHRHGSLNRQKGSICSFCYLVWHIAERNTGCYHLQKYPFSDYFTVSVCPWAGSFLVSNGRLEAVVSN